MLSSIVWGLKNLVFRTDAMGKLHKGIDYLVVQQVLSDQINSRSFIELEQNNFNSKREVSPAFGYSIMDNN